MFKSARPVLCIALIAHLSVFVLIALSGRNLTNPVDLLIASGLDTEQYLTLAQNIVEHGVFSLNSEPPFIPDLIRTPGYPLFLAVLYVIAGGQHSAMLILIVQQVLALFNVWLLIEIGRKLFTPTIAYVGGLLYAFAPAALIFTGLIMTETLFALFLLLSIYFLIHIFHSAGWRVWGLAIASAGCFALSVYVRPIGLYAIPILLLAVIVRAKWSGKAFALAFVIMAVYIACLLPWYGRNYRHYNAILFTSLANQNLLMYNISSVEAQRQGISWREAKDQLWVEFEERTRALGVTSPNQAETSAIMGDLAVEHFLAHPLPTIWYQFTDMANAFRPGYSMAAILMRKDVNELGSEVQEGNVAAIISAPFHELIVYGLMTVYYVLIYGMALAGAVRLIHQRQWFALILLGLTPFWFMFQPGAAGNARFRAPIEGLLALIAAVGLVWLVQWGMSQRSAVSPFQE